MHLFVFRIVFTSVMVLKNTAHKHSTIYALSHYVNNDRYRVRCASGSELARSNIS